MVAVVPPAYGAVEIERSNDAVVKVSWVGGPALIATVVAILWYSWPPSLAQ